MAGTNGGVGLPLAGPRAARVAQHIQGGPAHAPRRTSSRGRRMGSGRTSTRTPSEERASPTRPHPRNDELEWLSAPWTRAVIQLLTRITSWSFLQTMIRTMRQTWQLPRGSFLQTQSSTVRRLRRYAEPRRGSDTERHGATRSDMERHSPSAQTGTTCDTVLCVSPFGYACRIIA